jgi:hypothetical protein
VRAATTATVFACVCALSAAAEINLNPEQSFRELEGRKFPQLEFADGGRKITYEPPAGWEARPQDRHTLALAPPGVDVVSAKIKFFPTPGRLLLDEAQLTTFKETAHELLPPHGTIVGEPSVTANPLLLGGYRTCEVAISFLLHSQSLRMSVLFVDLEESQLRFSLISRASEFEKLHEAFRDSWFTWQWSEPVRTAATP